MITRVDKTGKVVRTNVRWGLAINLRKPLWPSHYVWGYPHSSGEQLHDPKVKARSLL